MDTVENSHGNIYICAIDTWKNKYYLTSELKFTQNIKEAAKFYFLKSSDDSFKNRDIISFNIGNKVLCIDEENNVKMIPREKIKNEMKSFTVTDGTDIEENLSYNHPYFLISDNNNKKVLQCKFDSNRIKNFPDNISLINDTMGEDKHRFVFIFEKYKHEAPAQEDAEDTAVKLKSEPNDEDKGFLMILGNYKEMLLILFILILIILCILVNR
jgi:hypothetical protein